MKKLVTILLVFALSLCAVACDNGKKTNKPGGDKNPSTGTVAAAEKVKLTLLTASAREKDANIIRDLLVKAGFDVVLNIQPDFASVKAVSKAGDYDMSIGAWNIVSGNPDYAMRPLFKSDAVYSCGLKDPQLDEMIDNAALTPFPEAWDLYAKLVHYMVEEKAYIVPCYGRTLNQAVNNKVVKPETAPLQKTRSGGLLQFYEYVNQADNDTRALNLTSVEKPVSYWTLRENDTYSAVFTENAYITLIHLSNEGVLETNTTLSYNFAQTDTNDTFYFLLRDNVNFARVEDKKAVDTGVRVSAEDVVFSLNCAKDKDFVPDQRIFDLFSDIDTVSIVTDLAELDEEITVDGKKIKLIKALSKGLSVAVNSLTADGEAVNNAGGVYQVVKIKTKKPSPQILYYLSHSAAGIFSKQSVEEYLSAIDLENYDPAKDVIYGDPSALTEGGQFNNMLWISGPYIPVYQNEFEGVMEKNPGYMPGTDSAPTIKTVKVKFINNYDTAVSAFRSGEIDVISWIPESYIPVLEKDDSVNFSMINQNNSVYIRFNLLEENKRVVLDENVRLAMLYAIDQQAFIDFYDGRRTTAYSPISMLYDDPNVVVKPDQAKVIEYLNKYFESKK